MTYKQINFLMFIISFSCFVFINNHCLFNNDEISTMIEMRMPFGEMLRFLFVEDVHPPVYFVLLKLWLSVFGDSLFSARCFSYAGLLACAFVGGNLIKMLYGKSAGLWYTAFFLFLPASFWLAKTIRMYSWACFFCTAAFLYAQAALSFGKRKDFILYVIYAFLAAWTHYYASFLCALIALSFLFVSWKKDKEIFKRFFVSNTVLFLLVCPEVYVFLRQNLSETDWIAMFYVKQAFFTYLSGASVSIFSLIVCIYLWIQGGQFLFADGDKNQKSMAKIGLFVALCFWFIPFLASFLYRPVLVYRYLMVALGCLYVFFLFGVINEKKNKIIIPILLVFSVLASVNEGMEKKKENIQSLFYEEIEKNVTQEDVIITDNWFIRLWISYYFPKHDIRILEENRKVRFYKAKYIPIERSEIKELSEKKNVFTTKVFVPELETIDLFDKEDAYTRILFSLKKILRNKKPEK